MNVDWFRAVALLLALIAAVNWHDAVRHGADPNKPNDAQVWLFFVTTLICCVLAAVRS